MADILKITTPLVNNNQPVQMKPGAEALLNTDIQNVTKVIQPNAQSELLKQNNGMIQHGDQPTILANLLKDPAVTAAYVKNIFMLEEIIKLLPANNRAMTEEIEQMFQGLLVQPEDIAMEMKQQEYTSTSFRGELFDLLREASRQNLPDSEVQGAIANLLRALNHVSSNKDIRDAVANSLQYLGENLDASKSLHPQLEELAKQFREPGAEKNFSFLKKETLSLLQDIRESVLFSPKLEKVVSITIYNLSRHNNNQTYLQESSSALWRLLEPNTRQQFQQALNEYMQKLFDPKDIRSKPSVFENGEVPPEEVPEEQKMSKVMRTLVDLVTSQSREDLSLNEQVRLEKIIHSLLSSPCNFTPLLHFVIPLLFGDMRSFAEIWINPNSDDREDSGDPMERGIHMLMVFDVDAIGRFEAELFVKGQKIDFALFCPPGSEEAFAGMREGVSKAVSSTSYELGDVRVETLQRSRSLMNVFKSLPYRRTGVDVKV